jgi:hypothetical protein
VRLIIHLQFGCIPLCSCMCSQFIGKDLAFLVRSTMQHRSITRGVVVLRLQGFRAKLFIRWIELCRDSTKSRVIRTFWKIRNPSSHQSPSPEPLGPRVLSEAIKRARFPARFRQPANIVKYSRETNPDVWLADYHLAC